MSPVMHEQMSRYTKTGGSDHDSSAASLSRGFHTAITLASTYAGAGQGMAGKGDSGAERMDEDEGGGERDEEDPYGLSSTLHTFNIVELCVRYTNRLSKDIARSGEAVFGAPPTGKSLTDSLTHSLNHSLTHSHCIILLTLTALTSPPILPLTDDAQASQVTVEKSSHTAMKGKSSLSPEMDKLKICKEDFEASKVSFQQVRVVMWCSIRCTCTKILECGISD